MRTGWTVHLAIVCVLGGCLIDRSALGGPHDGMDGGSGTDAFLAPGTDALGLDAHVEPIDAPEPDMLDAPDRMEPDVPIAPIADAWVAPTPDASTCSGVSETCNARDDDCDSRVDEAGCGAAPFPGVTLSCAAFMHAGHVYQLCKASVGVPWDAAVMGCALSPPYGIVRIDDNAENSAIASHVDEDAWIGLSDRGIEGAFTWADGTALDYASWAAMEPTSLRGASGGGEDCVSMRALLWQDRYCGAFAFPTDVSIRAFVCEAAIVP